MKKMIIIFLCLLVVCFIFKIYVPSDQCLLNNSICIFEFKYSNSIEKELYLNNKIDLEQKNTRINLNQIYPKGKNGFWNYCVEYSTNSIVCSFQELINIKQCKALSIDKYPIENWRLLFYKITLLDKNKYSIEIYNENKLIWMKKQKININQEVLCDP